MSIKIVAFNKKTGERFDIDDMYWFEENYVHSLEGDDLYSFEIQMEGQDLIQSFLGRLQETCESRSQVWLSSSTPLTETEKLLFHALELAGEAGEVANKVKKYVRVQRGMRGHSIGIPQIAAELADVVICTALVSNRLKIDLESAIIEKFNTDSLKHGFEHWLSGSDLNWEEVRSQALRFLAIDQESAVKHGISVPHTWSILPVEERERYLEMAKTLIRHLNKKPEPVKFCDCDQPVRDGSPDGANQGICITCFRPIDTGAYKDVGNSKSDQSPQP